MERGWIAVFNYFQNNYEDFLQVKLKGLLNYFYNELKERYFMEVIL